MASRFLIAIVPALVLVGQNQSAADRRLNALLERQVQDRLLGFEFRAYLVPITAD